MQLANSPAAALVDVVKRYGANTALDGVSLNIQRGKVTALLGPNGAGKSTAVALMLGLVTANAGRVELFGRSPQELAARRREVTRAGLAEAFVQITKSEMHSSREAA